MVTFDYGALVLLFIHSFIHFVVEVIFPHCFYIQLLCVILLISKILIFFFLFLGGKIIYLHDNKSRNVRYID